MCLKVENYLAEVNEVLALFDFEQHFFIFDEIQLQHFTYTPFQFPAQKPSVGRILRKRVMLKHDVCEDG